MKQSKLRRGWKKNSKPSLWWGSNEMFYYKWYAKLTCIRKCSSRWMMRWTIFRNKKNFEWMFRNTLNFLKFNNQFQQHTNVQQNQNKLFKIFSMKFLIVNSTNQNVENFAENNVAFRNTLPSNSNKNNGTIKKINQW